MEKERRLKIFSIVALIVAVIGLSIAFAALSKTLTINGTGSVDAANWDIHFKNISEPTLTGKATTTGTPSLADNGATINDMKVSLKEPGDKVVYTVDIENSGDINAEIDSITLPTFTTDQSNILDFKAVYTSNNKEIAQGDILESKETKNVTITIMYKDITDESLLPKEGISVNLKYELRFIQTDKASGSSSQGSGSQVLKTYNVGDKFCLNGESECFYTISDNGDTVTGLAEYNLLVGNEIQTDGSKIIINEPISTSIEGYGLQSARALGYNEGSTSWTGVIAFAEDKNHHPNGYWAVETDDYYILLSKYGNDYPAFVYDSNSLLYPHVENYKNYIRNTLRKESVKATLLSYEQVEKVVTFYGGIENVPNWTYSTPYWLGSADNYNEIWYISLYNYVFGSNFDHAEYSRNLYFGVRPVITISKLEL